MPRSPLLRIPRARLDSPPRRVITDTQENLSGGLNISADASQLGPTQIRRADNARLTIFGGVTKRLGSRNVHASAIGSGNPVRGGFGWLKDDGTQQILAVSNGKLNYGTYGVPMTFTEVSSPTLATTTVYPSFAAFRDASAEVVYIADGGKLLKWDGATLTRSATTPSVRRIWAYNQRLYGVNEDSTILYASGLNDGDDLGVTSGEGVQVPIRTFGDSTLLNGVALGAVNILAHGGGLSRWQGVTQEDINIDAGTLGISPDVGIAKASSLVATETEAFFLSHRGFYATDGFGVRPISPTLDPNLLDLFEFSDNLCAVHHQFYREVAWYLPNIGFYVYNYLLNAWTGPWSDGYVDPITHSCWQAQDSSGSPIVLVGTANGFVKQMDYPQVYKDNVTSAGTGGTAVQLVVQFRRQDFGDPASDKSLRFVYILVALNGSANSGITWTTNTASASATLQQSGGVIWGTPSMVWGSFVWGAGDAQEARVPVSGRGPYVDLTYTDSGTNPPPLVSAIRTDAFDYGVAHEYR